MQKRHSDSERYFNEQIYTTEKFILPYIQKGKAFDIPLQVLEIGCGEAGNLKPFLDLGFYCTGVDFNTRKIENGKKLFSSHPHADRISLISEDIYKVKSFESKFDIIFLRDVIEHIQDQDKFMGLMKTLMAPDGVAFFAFPPWQNPFGGHQQLCENKFLSMIPYFHLLPVPVYKSVLKIFGESEAKIKGLLEIKETGISIERFEKILVKHGYETVHKTLYFINPNYEIKFGLKPKELNRFIAKIKYLRNYFSTCGYYLIK